MSVLRNTPLEDITVSKMSSAARMSLRSFAPVVLGLLFPAFASAHIDLTNLPGVVIEVVRGNTKLNFADASDANVINALTDGDMATGASVTGSYRNGENGITDTNATEIGVNIRFPGRWEVEQVLLSYDIDFTAFATSDTAPVTSIAQVFLQNRPFSDIVSQTIDFSGPRGVGSSIASLPRRLTNPATLDVNYATNEVRLRVYSGCGISCKGIDVAGIINEIAVIGVPEPASLGWLLLGLPASALMLRRKR